MQTQRSKAINEVNDTVTLGKSQFRLSHLRSITEDEAIKHYTSVGNQTRIINAWKIANKKK
jgi:hypothetical protein